MPKPLTLDEIVEALQAEEDQGDIILFPPDDGDVTDEDSGDENEANILHLPSRMLRSQVETQNHPSMSGENLDEEEEQSMPARKKMKKKENTVKQWHDYETTASITTCGKGDRDEEVFAHLQEEMTPVQCFELLYSDELISYVVEMSNLYALQRNHTLNGASGPSLKMQSDLGLGAAVVLELHERLPQELGPYNLYFDNFFTGLPLIKHLREHNIGGTGTVRENRLENCKLPNSKEMKKEPRGKLYHKASEGIIVAKWHDNNIVTILSNCHGLDPITKVDRIGFVDKKRSKIQVDCPAVIKMYNKYMGGVDRFDENVDSMRVALRGKKWWFPLFAFGLDAACQNAWLIKRQSDNNWSYCDFRRNVVTTYLAMYGKPTTRNSACGAPLQLRVPNEVRNAGTADDHAQVDCSQRRCGYCHQRTRKMCSKCNIGLHLKCWYMFHNK
ncbi:unnamed protein product [Parnassius apollo]|uniref:(apollo) hypothetical protein n=1 Tax=Parnassius apollo TaxID=110799 RepID=A0A8S3XY00_PARAO|nr:unnamed protein product [Parnassius apollo]